MGAFKLLGLPAPMECSAMPRCRAGASARGRLRRELGLWKRLVGGVCKLHAAASGSCRLPSAVRGRLRWRCGDVAMWRCVALYSAPSLAMPRSNCSRTRGHSPATYRQLAATALTLLPNASSNSFTALPSSRCPRSLSLSLPLSLFVAGGGGVLQLPPFFISVAPLFVCQTSFRAPLLGL